MRNRCKHCGKAPKIDKWYMISYQLHSRETDRSVLVTRFWKGVKSIPYHQLNLIVKKSSVAGDNPRFHKNIKSREDVVFNSKHFVYCHCHKTRWYLEDINDSDRPERYHRLSRQRY
ncbi:MAG TPA: hypothetical protein VII94_03955 [Candidatus Saccharimonadales bacterium]